MVSVKSKADQRPLSTAHQIPLVSKAAEREPPGYLACGFSDSKVLVSGAAGRALGQGRQQADAGAARRAQVPTRRMVGRWQEFRLDVKTGKRSK